MAAQLSNSVFYHVPKTGGSWVRSALNRANIPRYEIGPDRTNPHGIPSEVEELYESARTMYSFCFVRHPFDWYKSFFCFRSLNGWKPGHEKIDDYETKDFGEFIVNCTSKSPGWLTERLRPYVDGVDFVGKQENLCEDLITALNTAGEFFDEEDIRTMTPVNQAADLPVSSDGGFDSETKKAKYGDRAVWTPELSHLVQESEKETFERFGY